MVDMNANDADYNADIYDNYQANDDNDHDADIDGEHHDGAS